MTTSFSEYCAKNNTQTVWFKFCDYAGNCANNYTRVDYNFSNWQASIIGEYS